MVYSLKRHLSKFTSRVETPSHRLGRPGFLIFSCRHFLVSFPFSFFLLTFTLVSRTGDKRGYRGDDFKQAMSYSKDRTTHKIFLWQVMMGILLCIKPYKKRRRARHTKTKALRFAIRSEEMASAGEDFDRQRAKKRRKNTRPRGTACFQWTPSSEWKLQRAYQQRDETGLKLSVQVMLLFQHENFTLLRKKRPTK